MTEQLTHTDRPAVIAGVSVGGQSGTVFCRRVIRCGYCGDLHSAAWSRCPQCHSTKVATA